MLGGNGQWNRLEKHDEPASTSLTKLERQWKLRSILSYSRSINDLVARCSIVTRFREWIAAGFSCVTAYVLSHAFHHQRFSTARRERPPVAGDSDVNRPFVSRIFSCIWILSKNSGFYASWYRERALNCPRVAQTRDFIERTAARWPVSLFTLAIQFTVQARALLGF